MRKSPKSRVRNKRTKKIRKSKPTPVLVKDHTIAALLQGLLQLCVPKETILPSVWQERYRIAPAGSIRSGKWRNFCYQIEPLDAIADPECSSLTLMMCSQFLGKSSIIEGALAWSIDQAPCPTVAVFPTADNATAWSKNRFGPLIEATPILSQLVDTQSTRKGTRSGYGNNTICHKKYPGGWFLGGGSNSPANLRAHTAKLTIFDEVDGYPDSAGDEGDVIILVEQRSARYPDAFSIKTSTPTVKHFSRIEKEFESTDQRKWFVTCPSCEHDYVIDWSHVRWPKEKENDGKTVHKIEKAYLECPSCKTQFSDKQRMQMVEKGRWVVTNPTVRGKRGYWANAFIVLGPHKRGFKSWLHYFAQRFLDASALGTLGLRTFQNLVCGETYELESTKPPEAELLYARREEYPEFEGEVLLPERCLFLVCGADVQQDRIEAEIVGYGLNEESWGIQYKVFRGSTETPELWNQFNEWIQKRWKHPSGHVMYPEVVCVDSGNKPKPVYDYSHRCSPRQVFAIKGERGYVANWVRRSTGGNQRLFLLKVDTPKEHLYSRLRLTEYGPGFTHFPSNLSAGYDATFFSQLCAETMRTSYVRGRFAPYFEQIHGGARNEALDARVYAMAAKELVGHGNIDYAAIQAQLAIAPLNDWRPKDPVPELPPAPPTLGKGNFPVSSVPPKQPPVQRQNDRRISSWLK